MLNGKLIKARQDLKNKIMEATTRGSKKEGVQANGMDSKKQLKAIEKA